MGIAVVNRSMRLGKLSIVVRGGRWVLDREAVSVRLPHGWQALVLCSKDMVDAGKSHLLVPVEALV